MLRNINLIKFIVYVQLYYYKYEKADQFEIKQAGRWDRIKSGEIKPYVFIPIENLLKII